MPTPTTQFAEPFAAFYRREYRGLVALAAAVSGSGSLAEDVAQEALLKAHQAWPKISSYDKPGAWVRRVTINIATNRRRRRASERRMAPIAGDRDRSVEIVLRDNALWRAVAELPPRQRAAIALFYLEDRSIADIAEILDCAPNTAKAHLHQGRQALHARLDREELR